MTMDDEITKVRKQLEDARDALNGTEINVNNYSTFDVAILNRASTVAWWAIRDAISVLADIAPEAIRRECARSAKQAILSAPHDNPTRAYAASLAEESIISAEPAQGGKDGCARCRNRPLPGASRALCESCKLVIGKNYDPRPVNSEPAQDDGKAEVGLQVEAWVWPSGEWKIRGASKDAWKEHGAFQIVPITLGAEAIRRVDEAK